MPLRVDSEIGRLRRVLVHRPRREIDWMVPSMMGALLFDDILYGEDAREEHDLFCNILKGAGVEVLDAQTLLSEVLQHGEPRFELLEELGREYGVSSRMVGHLALMSPEELAASLIEGVRCSPEDADAGRQQFFQLNPVPNYFFQRDPQAVLGNRVVISSMATDAREREPLLARTFIRHHPAFAGSAAIFDIDVPPSGAPEHNPNFQYPSLEGGDILVVSPEIVLVGLSERTNRRGAEVLAEYLRLEETSFRHLLMVELPRKRSYMHLDTVFTLIDRGTCLAHVPVVQSGGPESAHIYRVDLYARDLTFTLRPSLLEALAELGMELEVVPCGGSVEAIDQEREQWTDGANSFAVAPGVILLYRRNRRTLEELSQRGWRVLTTDEALSGEHGLLDGGRTAVALFDNELSRARGGPHCMTMPLQRDSL
ncbi:MAG TPA: arginine deiminase family protein [Thermoanaerobaculia bacterium]